MLYSSRILFYSFEITYSFVYRLDKGKRIIVLIKYILKIDYLMFIDDSDYHIFFGIAVNARPDDFRRAVFECFDYFFIDFGGM